MKLGSLEIMMQGCWTPAPTESYLLWLPGPQIRTCQVKLMTCKFYSPESLGRALPPDIVFSNSTWVKGQKGFLPVGTQTQIYLPSLRKFYFLWVAGARGGWRRAKAEVSGLRWTVPREEEQGKDRKSLK